MSIVGYRIKLHSALTAPILLGGVPRNLAILNGTLCAAFVLGLHAIYMLPIFVIVHFIAIFAAKRDPFFFEVAIRHLHKKKYYKI